MGHMPRNGSDRTKRRRRQGKTPRVHQAQIIREYVHSSVACWGAMLQREDSIALRLTPSDI